jgi:hypothetical protein
MRLRNTPIVQRKSHRKPYHSYWSGFYSLLILLILLVGISKVNVETTSKVANAYTPPAGSPLALKQHPRLHITPATIPNIRNYIASDANYKAKYQTYVNFAATASPTDAKNFISETRESILQAPMVAQAYIGALGVVPGIDYKGLTPTDFSRKAIDALKGLMESNNPIGYHPALVYDWAYSALTEAEKQQLINRMFYNLDGSERKIETRGSKPPTYSLQNPAIPDGQPIMSSNYFEAAYAFYLGLAFYGDGLTINNINADNVFLNDIATFYTELGNYGYADAVNFTAGNEGGFTEWNGYTGFHTRAHYLLIDSWRTATGENFINNNNSTINGNAIKTIPQLFYYNTDPFTYTEGSSFIRMGGGSPSTVTNDWQMMTHQLHMLVRILADAGATTEAGLLKSYNQQYPVKWPSLTNDYIFAFLGIPLTQPAAVSPNILSKSLWFKNMGTFIARTGFTSQSDSFFSVNDSHYFYSGHSGPWYEATFRLAKFGELINSRYGNIRGGGNLEDYAGSRQSSNTIFFDANAYKSTSNINIIRDKASIQAAVTSGSTHDWSGIEQITKNGENFYHVRVNRGMTTPTKVSDGAGGNVQIYASKFATGVSHTREYVWFPGSNPNSDSDFLVIYDRTKTPTAQRPEWVYNVPWLPTVTGASSTTSLVTGSSTTDRIGNRYTGTNMTLKELNSIGDEVSSGAGAHGVAFVKTLLPAQTQIETGRIATLDATTVASSKILGIKNSRWQISERPETASTDHRYLHVIQTGDANLKSNMVGATTISAGTMEGSFMTQESSSLPNHAVLFSKDAGINSQAFSYSIPGAGITKHVITGLKPGKSYTVNDGTSSRTISTEGDVQLWDYKSAPYVNTQTGVLYFDTASVSGTRTVTVSEVGGDSNLPPLITISTSATSFTAPANIAITSTVSDTDGISKVEFYQGSTLLNVDTISPYSYTWSGVVTGSYTLYAKAYDTKGAIGFSNTINITVNSTVTPPPPPTTTLVGDINKDGIVNSLDWSVMNSKWLTTDTNSDLNKDGIVNSIDYSLLNANWFKTG